jgi:hypothetical protein
MHTKTGFVVLFLLVLAVGSCAPLVPYNQMPGQDLYGGANSSRMTANAALQQAQWMDQAMTATAAAPVGQMTATGAALAVQATQAAATTTAGVATQAAAMTSTAVWWTPTPNMTGTLDALAIEAAQTQTTLNLQQAQANNDFKAHVQEYAFFVVVLLIAGTFMLVARKQRFQFGKTDERGNLLPVLDIVDGTVTDVDRNPNFKGNMKNDWLVRLAAHWFEKKTGARLMLPEVTEKRQDAVTLRDQMIDLATRGLPQQSSRSEDARKAKAGEMMIQPQLQAPLKVQVIAPDQVRPILLDVVPQIAQDSIEAELYETQTQKEEGVV